MKKINYPVMKKVILLSAIVFAFGCGGGASMKQMLQVSLKIRNDLGANNCQVGISKSTGINKVTIEIDGLGEKFLGEPREKIASVAVMMYYQSIDPKEVKFEETRVDINVGGDHYDKTFKHYDIERAFKLFKPISQFFEMAKANDFSGYEQIMDTAYFPDSVTVTLGNAIAEIDSTAGEKISKIRITGFKTDRLEESLLPVTCFWVEATSGDFVTYFNFYFLDENEKMIHVGINEGMENGSGKTETTPPATPQTPQ